MNIEEILEVIEKDPKLALAVLESVPNIKGGKEYLENSNKAYYKASIGADVSKLYNNIEADIFEVTGKRKEGSEKTFDFVKKILSNYKNKLQKLESKEPDDVKKLKETITELEEKVKNGGGSSHWKENYEDLRKQLEDKQAEFDSKISGYETQIFEGKVGNELATALGSLTINKNIPEEVVNSHISNIKKQLLDSAKIENGSPVFYDENGSPYLDKQHKVAGAKYVLEGKLQSILAVEEKQAGGGNASKSGTIKIEGAGDSAITTLELDRSLIRTKSDFINLSQKAFAEAGIVRGDKNYNKIIEKAYEDYDVSNLPRE